MLGHVHTANSCRVGWGPAVEYSRCEAGATVFLCHMSWARVFMVCERPGGSGQGLEVWCDVNPTTDV